MSRIPLQAQVIAGYGFKAGVNSSTADIEYLAIFEQMQFEGGRRTGFHAAFFIESFKHQAFSLLAQMEYAQRGFVEGQALTGPDGPEPLGTILTTSRLDYISVPLLIKLQSRNTSINPFITFGPRLDFLINREPGKIFSDEGNYVPTPFADFFKDRAWGGAVSLGLATNKIVALPLLFEVRYNFDFTDNIAAEIYDAKKSALDIWLGMAF